MFIAKTTNEEQALRALTLDSNRSSPTFVSGLLKSTMASSSLVLLLALQFSFFMSLFASNVNIVCMGERRHVQPRFSQESHHEIPTTMFRRPTPHLSVRAHFRARPQVWLAQLPEPSSTIPITTPATPPEDGPIELPSSTSSIFATTDDPSPLQVATSVLLTGAISVFLFRSLRRRAKRAKVLRFRSTGATRTLKDEALDSLKAMRPTSVEAGSPPSPIQALLGGLSAGVIALVLYKFTTTIEAALNRQTISDNFSVRQMTITIRTIVNGLCYLATFVFGINSVGLILYSGQLAINSFMEGSRSEAISDKDDGQQSTQSPLTMSFVENEESSNTDGDSRSDEPQSKKLWN